MAAMPDDVELRRHASELLSGKAKPLLEAEQLTMRMMRQLLEEKLGLAPKSLNAKKESVCSIVDELLVGIEARRNSSGASPKPGVKVSAQGKCEQRANAAGDGGKENTRPAGKGDAGGSGGKTKPIKKTADGDGREETRHERSRKHAKTKEKASARAEEPYGSEGGGSSGNEQSEGEEARPNKRAKKGARAPTAAGARSKSLSSRAIERMKDICKRASIKIGPNLYIRHRTTEDLEAALQELLERQGLNAKSGDREILQVRRRLERDRDMEGIDTSNILQENAGGERPRRRAAATVNFSKMFEQPKLSDDEEDGSGDESDGGRRPAERAAKKGSTHRRVGNSGDGGGGDSGSESGSGSGSEVEGSPSSRDASAEEEEDGRKKGRKLPKTAATTKPAAKGGKAGAAGKPRRTTVVESDDGEEEQPAKHAKPSPKAVAAASPAKGRSAARQGRKAESPEGEPEAGDESGSEPSSSGVSDSDFAADESDE